MKPDDIHAGETYEGQFVRSKRHVIAVEGKTVLYKKTKQAGKDIYRCQLRTFANWAGRNVWPAKE